MPTLHWIGKDKVINHHLDVPFKVLEHSYGFDNGKQTQQETQSGNKIIHGDNLEALKALLPEYEGFYEIIVSINISSQLFFKSLLQIPYSCY